MENGHAKYRVAVIGSGNWGSVASRLIASNTAKLPSFYDEVRMWVFEEILPTGKKLSESINEQNVRVQARQLILLLDQQIKWRGEKVSRRESS